MIRFKSFGVEPQQTSTPNSNCTYNDTADEGIVSHASSNINCQPPDGTLKVQDDFFLDLPIETSLLKPLPQRVYRSQSLPNAEEFPVANKEISLSLHEESSFSAFSKDQPSIYVPGMMDKVPENGGSVLFDFGPAPPMLEEPMAAIEATLTKYQAKTPVRSQGVPSQTSPPLLRLKRTCTEKNGAENGRKKMKVCASDAFPESLLLPSFEENENFFQGEESKFNINFNSDKINAGESLFSPQPSWGLSKKISDSEKNAEYMILTNTKSKEKDARDDCASDHANDILSFFSPPLNGDCHSTEPLDFVRRGAKKPLGIIKTHKLRLKKLHSRCERSASNNNRNKAS